MGRIGDIRFINIEVSRNGWVGMVRPTFWFHEHMKGECVADPVGRGHRHLLGKEKMDAR